MLFLKRASDLFDQRRAELKKELAAKGMAETDIDAALNDPDNYSGKYFFVPENARRNEGWDEQVAKDGETRTVFQSFYNISCRVTHALKFKYAVKLIAVDVKSQIAIFSIV
jgi:hypothetical protein